MDKVMKRARIVIVLVLVLTLGLGFFLGEYLIKSDSWIMFPGSPHIYNAGNIGCGVIADRDGNLLLDLKNGRTYASNVPLKRSVIHWLGDRGGRISAPALSHYAAKIAGFDPINGVYAYGGTGGQANLTLSAKVQIAAVEAMGDYTGTIAVYNYQTGQILCAVTTPSFDPDDVPDIDGDTTGRYDGVYVNRFTQSTYTPGSIFKIVTAAAAMEHIPDIREQTFTCYGSVSYGADEVTCEKAHGTLTFGDAFTRSCNCAFAAIADQLGGEILERYARQFGVLDSVEFDGITTAQGSISANNAAAVQVAWSAIGQHKDLVNPCAYLTFVGAVASGGVGVKPYLVESIHSGTQTTYRASIQRQDRIMSTGTAKALRDMMRANVENYYGDENFPGLTVCAKSGTAEVGGDRKPNAMFTGFLLDDDYPLAFIVCIEDGGYARPVCVPVLAKVLEACVDAMDA